jgi:RND family efflux transporter MFP subunit
VRKGILGRITAAVILAAAVTLVGCGRKPDATAEAGPKPGAAAESKAAAGSVVSVASVTTGPIEKRIEVNGSLVALRDVIVGAKQAGRLAQVLPHEGDRVTAGQVVAILDTADLQAQVQQAQANIQAAITKQQQAIAARQQAVNAVAQARNAVRNAETTTRWTDKTTSSAVQVAQGALDTAIQRLSVTKQGARPQERQQAEEAVASAKANYEKARSDLKRYQALFREQAVSQSQLDEKQAAFDGAQASYNSAQQSLSLIREGARQEDIRTAELAVQSARDGLERAKADRDQVQLRREDVQTAKSNLESSRVGVRAADAGVEAAKAGVAQARAALRIVQEGLNYAYIKSPINGIVAERRAEPGSQLGGGGTVLRIVDPSSVYFQAVLSESQYGDIRLGQPADVSIDAIPETTTRPIPGRVSRLLPVASAAARSFTVRIDLPVDARMRPQMFARGRILADVHRAATLVPKDAVLFDPGTRKARVFVAKSGKADQREVRVGLSNPRYVEIIGDAVTTSDKVIVAGQTSLQDGDTIRVQ